MSRSAKTCGPERQRRYRQRHLPTTPISRRKLNLVSAAARLRTLQAINSLASFDLRLTPLNLAPRILIAALRYFAPLAYSCFCDDLMHVHGPVANEPHAETTAYAGRLNFRKCLAQDWDKVIALNANCKNRSR